MSKRIIHALIACAIGVALGLSVDCAQAANDVDAEAFGPLTFGQQLLKCKNAGGWHWTCTIDLLPEAMALQEAKATLRYCAAMAQLYAEQFPRSAGGELHATVEKDCARQRAYIKQRWGY